jgi:glycosyltransferase involved in cell wall biosynthesis
MIITIVTETYWPEINGVAMTLERWVNGLIERGHQIQLIYPHIDERDVAELPKEIHYYPVMGFPIPGYSELKFGVASKKFFKKLWQSENPDAIYVATEGPLGWAAVKAANELGIKIISGFHTNFHSYSQHYKIGFLQKILQRYLVEIHNRTDTTLVPTEQQKQELLNMGINHVEVLGRGVDVQLFSPAKRSAELRAQWGVYENDPVLLYVGRIAEEKNLDLSIEAYYTLRQTNDKLKFVFVGDGPMRKKLQKEHRELIFAGKRVGDDLAAHYASCDIFLFSSLTETFGNVILEAMASGLGVASFDCAAAHIHIAHRESGMLADVDKPKEFVNNAKLLVQNELLLKKIRASAEKYPKQYSWANIVAQFETILLRNHIEDDEAVQLENVEASEELELAYSDAR